MNAENTRKKLFEEFPPISTEQWEAKIIEDLKGADYAKKLNWKTEEGFTAKPYYRQEDLDGLTHLNHHPGTFPFVRGKETSGNYWRIRQDIEVKNIGLANEKALEILMKGIDSLGFILREDYVYTYADIDALLRNIHAHAVEINFICGEQAPSVMAIIDQLVKQYNRDLNQIHGAVDYDPLSRLLCTGDFAQNEEETFATAKQLIEKADHLPHFRVIAVHGSLIHNAGGTIVQELAYALAAGNEYLARITGLGLSVTRIAPRIRFNFSTGSNYFMEIAKYRAARMLWARIVQEYGGDDTSAKMNIRALTSQWNKTLYDPHVNMLRTTTEAMSAILGGIDSLTISPYDTVYAGNSDMGERVARNQQLLIKEESYFDKVADPAAGSYYIESLTDALAASAWKVFQEIESKGGFLAMIKAGVIQEEIRASAQKKDMDIATRRKILIGTNQYPNSLETMLQELEEDILFPKNLAPEGLSKDVITPYRGAQAFERLRYATDMYVKNGGERPKVFLLTYGNLAMRKARATFSSNFFACAGFDVLKEVGYESVSEGITAARKSGAQFVVACSSDEEYKDAVIEINEALKEKAVTIVAGYPKELLDELKAAGISEFIHLRTNVLESLQRFQNIAGIQSI